KHAEAANHIPHWHGLFSSTRNARRYTRPPGMSNGRPLVTHLSLWERSREARVRAARELKRRPHPTLSQRERGLAATTPLIKTLPQGRGEVAFDIARGRPYRWSRPAVWGVFLAGPVTGPRQRLQRGGERSQGGVACKGRPSSREFDSIVVNC